ncbi:MAG: glycine--tRNA ligase subunit beta, partial [Gammaproteobacteria bacterium]
MSDTRTLLVEIGTEELPPKALKTLSEALGDHLLEALKEARLADDGDARLYATPRRLAVKVANVRVGQPDQEVERKGPAVAAAFDADGKPTKAAEGFARSCGVSVDELGRVETPKGECLAYQTTVPGKPAAELIPELLDAAVKKLPIPKRMRWSDLDAEFVRPVHWLVLLHGSDVIDAEMLSVKSGRETYGHRFHAPGALTLASADDYPAPLGEKGFVTADFAERRNKIAAEARELARGADGQIVVEESLLDEVTSLVEWPVPLLGDFNPDYLDVPQEALISYMQDHQKYFPVVDTDGKLMPRFITVANIESKDPTVVVAGNERVLNARLSDARFFWDTDRKQTLESRVEKLDTILFHKKLGSVLDKVKRVQSIAAAVAQWIGADVDNTRRAALLAKADLVSDMVGEFPELQGIMGRYYAVNDGEADEVAQAIEEQYWPRFAGDNLPESGAGQALAIADKIDSLAGIFSTGELPTGTKDPYGLRRAALGLLRIIIEKRLPIDLRELLRKAGRPFENADSDAVLDYVLERLPAYYADEGLDTDTVNAVLSLKPG